MSKVYITNASLNLIVRSLRKIKTLTSHETMAKEILSDIMLGDELTAKDLQGFYNTLELKDMFNIKMVLKNFTELIETIGEDRKFVSDYILEQNKRYANDVKVPAYHSDNACHWMKLNFTNIKLPDNFASNTKRRNEAKKWIIDNKHNSFDELNTKFIEHFETTQILSEVNYKNSGNKDLENVDISLEFHQEIKEQKGQMIMLLNGPIAKVIANHRYMPHFKLAAIEKHKNPTKEQEAIIDFHIAKQIMQQIIYQKFYEKYNIDLSFDNKILDLIGFRACRGCALSVEYVSHAA